jgi:hypothetical protein
MRAWSQRIRLHHLPDPSRLARLREPAGDDELSLQGTDTRSAVQLLDRLSDAPGTSAAELSASDRDRMLAALYRALWGDRIVSSLTCAACGAVYDLSFELSGLQREVADKASAVHAIAPRVIEDAAGVQFHLPDAGEEEAAAELGVAVGVELLRGSIAAAGAGDVEALSGQLDLVAPLIDVDLDTQCAECGRAAEARFDIQSFALQRLLDERQTVLSEVHVLASGYGWSLQDILSLPRSFRQSLVQRLTSGLAASG